MAVFIDVVVFSQQERSSTTISELVVCNNGQSTIVGVNSSQLTLDSCDIIRIFHNMSFSKYLFPLKLDSYISKELHMKRQTDLYVITKCI